MSLQPNRVTVTTTATRLDWVDTVLAKSVLFRNRGSVPIYVGGPGVTTSTGFQLDAGERMRFDLRADGVYAVTESGSAVVHCLQLGQ